MDELRNAVRALADDLRAVEAALATNEDVPSKAQLAGLQRSVDRIQQSLNRLQTAIDAWSEETESG
jgi:hypothetical protein